MKQRRTTSVVVMGLVLSVVRVASAYDTDDNNFRPDVFSCEVALATLAECCPGFDPKRVRCSYLHEESTGCDFKTSTTVRPALDKDESKCVLASTCELLQERGVCRRAQVATDYVEAQRSHDRESPPQWRDPSTHEPVCP